MAGKDQLWPETAAAQNLPQMSAFGKIPQRHCGKIWRGQDTGTEDEGGLGNELQKSLVGFNPDANL